MKKFRFLSVLALVAFMFAACTSTDSLIDKYEQAVKNGNTQEAFELAEKLEKKDLTLEQEKRLTQITFKSASDLKEPDVEEIVVKEPVAEKVTSTVNIDQLLDSYDQYVDKYIAVMKKANAGDINAISDMSDLLQSTQDFESKLNNVSGDFSTKQLARYTRITNKMTKAAL
jgi:hypothetical protein